MISLDPLSNLLLLNTQSLLLIIWDMLGECSNILLTGFMCHVTGHMRYRSVSYASLVM